MNNINIIGRLTHEPENRITSSGIEVVNFSVAVQRRYGNNETDFINCVAWRKTAELVKKYFGKGDIIGINGSLQQENYTKDNIKINTYRVQVESVYFCSSTSKQRNKNQIEQNDFVDITSNAVAVDDLPF